MQNVIFHTLVKMGANNADTPMSDHATGEEMTLLKLSIFVGDSKCRLQVMILKNT